MVRIKLTADQIQLGTLIISGLCMLGGFWGYCEAHFAEDKSVQSEIVQRQADVARLDSGNAVMSSEIHQLYLLFIDHPVKSGNNRITPPGSSDGH